VADRILDRVPSFNSMRSEFAIDRFSGS
jgi:hypothetical protein